MLWRAMRSADAQRPTCERCIVVSDEQRHGAWWARNRGLEQVETSWVAWLDDDDWLYPNHLKVLTRGANRSGADMVFSYADFPDGRDPLACCLGGKLIERPAAVPFGSDQRLHLDSRDREYCPACRYLTGNFIPVTYLVRTELVRAVGGFPEPYSMPTVRTSGECEDYLLLLKMLDAGASFHHVVDVCTWAYTMHGANTGGRGADRMHELEGSRDHGRGDRLGEAGPAVRVHTR